MVAAPFGVVAPAGRAPHRQRQRQTGAVRCMAVAVAVLAAVAMGPLIPLSRLVLAAPVARPMARHTVVVAPAVHHQAQVARGTDPRVPQGQIPMRAQAAAAADLAATLARQTPVTVASADSLVVLAAAADLGGQRQPSVPGLAPVMAAVVVQGK